MRFQGKYDQARERQKEQMKGQQRAYDVDNLESQLDKHDTLAMILAALVTFIPLALLAIGLICLVGWLFVFR